MPRAGGIRINDSSATLTRTRIANNRTLSSNSRGGGLAVSDSNVQIIESTIASNKTSLSQSRGGGLAASFSDIILDRSTFSGNSTQASGVHGGGRFHVAQQPGDAPVNPVGESRRWHWWWHPFRQSIRSELRFIGVVLNSRFQYRRRGDRWH